MYLYCRLLVFSSQVCCVPSGSAGECAGLHATSLPRGQAFYQQLLCGYSQHFKSSIQTQHHRQLWVSGTKHWLCVTFIRHKHCPTHIQVFTGKPDKSRCFKIQVLQSRQCCSVLLWCFPVHWGSRCPGVFVCLILFSLLTHLRRQNCAVLCVLMDSFIVWFLTFSVWFIVGCTPLWALCFWWWP